MQLSRYSPLGYDLYFNHADGSINFAVVRKGGSEAARASQRARSIDITFSPDATKQEKVALCGRLNTLFDRYLLGQPI